MDAVTMALMDLEQGRFMDDRDGALLFLIKEWEPSGESEAVIDLQEKLSSVEDTLVEVQGDATKAEGELDKLKGAIRFILKAAGVDKFR